MTHFSDILLDRDGTVIADAHYLSDPAQVALLPGAAQALARLSRAGMNLYLVTNQSGIGRGYYAEDDYQAVRRRLEELLAPHGVRFRATLHCPHAPDAGCACRKPGTGMWDSLRRDYGLRPETAVMIGDNTPDMDFAKACSLARSILVLTGHGARTAATLGLPPLEAPWAALPGGGHPHVLARDLAAATDHLLGPET